MAGLPAGESYELRFQLNGYAEGQRTIENLRAFEERSDLYVVLDRGRRTVIAEHEVYQRVARDVDVEKGVNRLDLVFEGGVDVSGRVIGPQGEPIADASVQLAGSGAFFFLGNETDSRGYFALTDVPEGSWKLIAQRPGFAPAEELVDVRGAVVPELEIEMTPTEGLYFEAALGVGGAPTRVHAAVLRTPGSTDVLVAGYGIETGENGRVRLTEVPPGSFELLVAAQGTVTVAAPVVSPGQLGRVVLPIGGVLTVRVPVLAGQPAKVRLASPSGAPYRQISFGGRIITEPPAGRPIEGLLPGTWRFTVTADDGRSWAGEARVEASQIVEVVLE